MWRDRATTACSFSVTGASLRERGADASQESASGWLETAQRCERRSGRAASASAVETTPSFFWSGSRCSCTSSFPGVFVISCFASSAGRGAFGCVLMPILKHEPYPVVGQVRESKSEHDRAG